VKEIGWIRYFMKKNAALWTWLLLLGKAVERAALLRALNRLKVAECAKAK
jgi:hypothetical protein